eukprot:5135604-Pyramimonas_sp.AAC.1
MIGVGAPKQLEGAPREWGLRVQWINEPARAQGVGGREGGGSSIGATRTWGAPRPPGAHFGGGRRSDDACSRDSS